MSLRTWAVTTAFAVAVAACAETIEPPVEVTPGEVSVPVGLSRDVTVTEGDAPADLDNTDWMVADPSVATVTWDEDHLVVRGRAVGRTYAVADHRGAELVVDVVVTEAIVQGLEVDAPARVPVGATMPIVATARMSDNREIDVSAEATWTLEDDEVAEIQGIQVQGRQPGTTSGRVEFAGYSASFDVQVVDATLASITVSPPSPYIAAGIEVVFSAAGVYTDGTVVDLTTNATWALSDPGVAALVGHQATGVAAGTTDVTASYAGLTGSTRVTVSNAVPVALRVTPDVATVAAGFAETFHAVVTLSDDHELDVTDQVTWTSSAPLVASVQSGSTVHAWRPGTTAVTANLGDLADEARLDVSEAVLVSLELTPGTMALHTGAWRFVEATGYLSDGTSLDMTGEVTWWTTDTSTIEVTSGIIEARAPGRGVARASLDTIVGTAEVEVTDPARRAQPTGVRATNR